MSCAGSGVVAFQTAAWSWVEHLRSGGTTTWRVWRSAEHPPVQPRWATLPNAAQLEVVRLLAQQQAVSRGAGGGPFAAIVDRVVGTPVSGRGLVDPKLPWPSEADTGAPRTEPDQLPVRELLRVCVAGLAACFADQPAAPSPARRPRRRPWQPAFVVAGVSPQAEVVRRSLLDSGHVEGGRHPTALVVGGPLDAMATMLWRRRVERGAGTRWRRLWAGLAARDELPATLDLATTADNWVGRVGADSVHVLIEKHPANAVDVAGRVLGVETMQEGPRVPDVVTTDLLRRLNQVLATQGPQTTKAMLASPFEQLFFGNAPPTSAGGRTLGVPLPQLPWALERAEDVATRLAAGSFTLHGDPRTVVPTSRPETPRSVDPRDTLTAALGALAICEKVGRATAGSTRRRSERGAGDG